MTIDWVETVRVPEHPDYLWVRVGDSAGVIGTGETMPRVDAVERLVHQVLAPLLIGSDPAPAAFWDRAFKALAYHGYAGAELRALSAVDIALWDIVGQHAGLPVHRVLGGPLRDKVAVYNTCVSAGGVRDHERFRTESGLLARELADAGYTVMKIWPFDDMSVPTLGQRIDRRQLDQVARTFGEIRDAVGDDIEVALEGHSCWNLPSAVRIARTLEPYQPIWLEDMMQAREPAAWRRLKDETSIAICGGERLFTRYQVAAYLDAGALDIVKQDLCWTGGFTELVKVAALADRYELPIAPHNCHGPVGAMATLQLSAAIPNLYLMESVRSFCTEVFPALADDAPAVHDGAMRVPDRPGLGIGLRADVLAAATRVRSDVGGTTGWAAGDPWVARTASRQ